MLRETAHDTGPVTMSYSRASGLLSRRPARHRPPPRSARPDMGRRMLAALQTSLDAEELLRIFSRELAEIVPHSSVRYRNRHRELDVRLGRPARYACSFHLLVDREEIGELAFGRGRPFSAEESGQVERLVGCLVFPLRNALRFRDAVEASHTDPLTGTGNRQHMDSTLKREIALARRHGTPFSLLVLDVDGFKAINDRLGHEAGDAVLRTLGARIGECLRETDILCRYGGDEFTVLLSNTPRTGAMVVARHILAHLADAVCETGGEAIRPEVSVGVATLRTRDKQGALFARADAALYEAKRAGGGRIAYAARRGCRVSR